MAVAVAVVVVCVCAAAVGDVAVAVAAATAAAVAAAYNSNGIKKQNLQRSDISNKSDARVTMRTMMQFSA